MATRKSAVPARKTQVVPQSPLLRSAESLGRMIGALQRQIDRIARQLPIDLAHSATPAAPPRKRKAAAKGAAKKKAARKGAAKGRTSR